MRVGVDDVLVASGAALVSAGLFGLWGWPAAALFAGSLMLLLGVGAAFARKGKA